MAQRLRRRVSDSPGSEAFIGFGGRWATGASDGFPVMFECFFVSGSWAELCPMGLAVLEDVLVSTSSALGAPNVWTSPPVLVMIVSCATTEFVGGVSAWRLPARHGLAGTFERSEERVESARPAADVVEESVEDTRQLGAFHTDVPALNGPSIPVREEVCLLLLQEAGIHGVGNSSVSIFAHGPNHSGHEHISFKVLYASLTVLHPFTTLLHGRSSRFQKILMSAQTVAMVQNEMRD